jgi:hypothetical protein
MTRKTKDEWDAHHRELCLAYYRKRRSEDPTYGREYRNEYAKSQPWLSSYNSARTRAKKIDVPWDLTRPWCRERWTGCCEITGIPFQKNPNGSGKGPWSFSPSIDRIDSSRGYVKDNCKYILFGINGLKSTGSYLDAYNVAKAFVIAVEERALRTALPEEFALVALIFQAIGSKQ